MTWFLVAFRGSENVASSISLASYSEKFDRLPIEEDVSVVGTVTVISSPRIVARSDLGG
jgi:hypothetical protein